MRFVVTGASYGESLDVYMGNAATVEAMTIEGPKMTDIKGNLTPGYMLADFNAGDRWKNRSRLGQCAGADWDTFDAAKLMIFSETVAF